MSTISPVDQSQVKNNYANYNAVKIRVNDPKTNILSDANVVSDNNGIYTGVDIEVNRPTVEVNKQNTTKIYDYPEAKSPVTSQMAGFAPVDVPKMDVVPLAYSASYVEYTPVDEVVEENIDQKVEEPSVDADNDKAIVEEAEIPAPNLTTTDAEKLDFNSDMAFRGNVGGVQVDRPVKVSQDMNVDQIISNLQSSDLDKQAIQMDKLASLSIKNPKVLSNYATTEVFTELINIINKDTSKMEPPTEKQKELRKQFIINKIVKEKAQEEEKDLSKIELPYKLSGDDIKELVKLSPLEKAERNKEYALYMTAALSKSYANDLEDKTGNVVPLTDLPGVSDIVNVLRNEKNTSLKFAAIDALTIINREEYKDELVSILTMATKDNNPLVAKAANETLKLIQLQEKK